MKEELLRPGRIQSNIRCQLICQSVSGANYRNRYSLQYIDILIALYFKFQIWMRQVHKVYMSSFVVFDIVFNHYYKSAQVVTSIARNGLTESWFCKSKCFCWDDFEFFSEYSGSSFDLIYFFERDICTQKFTEGFSVLMWIRDEAANKFKEAFYSVRLFHWSGFFRWLWEIPILSLSVCRPWLWCHLWEKELFLILRHNFWQ